MLGRCNVVAAVAAEYFDEPLDPHCRELAYKIGHNPAVFAPGGFLLMDLLSRRGSHVTIGGDELVRSVKFGHRMTTVSRTGAPSFIFGGFPRHQSIDRRGARRIFEG
jgi:hypothetical protein